MINYIDHFFYKMISLDHLVVLEAIVENGSFRMAANALHKAQSAVSYAIKELENQLGIVLFNRETYRPTLTDAGEAFYPKAKRLLQNARELSGFGRLIRQDIEPVLYLGVSALYPLAKLTPLLRDIQTHFPKTDIYLQMDILNDESRILSDEVHLAIVEKIRDNDLLDMASLQSVKMPVVVASSHPLAAYEGPVDRSVLLQHPQIIVKSSGSHPSLKAGILEGAPRWTVSDFPAKHMILLNGLGWGRMPEHIVHNDLDAGRLKEITMEHAGITEVPLTVIRKREYAHGRVAQYIWNSLTKTGYSSPSYSP